MGWSEIYLIPTKPLSLSLSLSLFFKVKNLKCLLTTIWSWMMDAVADFPLSLSVFLTRCDILFGKITKAKLPFTFIQSKKKKKKDCKAKPSKIIFLIWRFYLIVHRVTNFNMLHLILKKKRFQIVIW